MNPSTSIEAIPDENERVDIKIDQFEEAWNNTAFGLSVHEVSEKMLTQLRAVAPETPNFPLLETLPVEEPPGEAERRRWRHRPRLLKLSWRNAPAYWRWQPARVRRERP